jgi:hypothetical protein
MALTPVSKKVEEIELAFGVIKVTKELYAVKIVMYQGSKVLDTRIGAGTTLGHAICEAEDLVANFNLYIEGNPAENYFATVKTI